MFFPIKLIFLLLLTSSKILTTSYQVPLSHQSFRKGFTRAGKLTYCIGKRLVAGERTLHVVCNSKKTTTEEEISSVASNSEQLKLYLISVLLHVFISFTNPLLQNPADATTSFDDYFSTSSKKYEDPLKVKARKELNNLKNLQDSRLEICADKGKNWEQCFMFGESPTIQQSEQKIFWHSGDKDINKNDVTTKSRTNSPPTW